MENLDRHTLVVFEAITARQDFNAQVYAKTLWAVENFDRHMPDVFEAVTALQDRKSVV